MANLRQIANALTDADCYPKIGIAEVVRASTSASPHYSRITGNTEVMPRAGQPGSSICADQIICEACEERNPQSRRRLVPRACLQPRDICVNFVDCRGLAAQAMALDHRTMLGPQLRIQSAETLRRLLAYLGATPEQLADFDRSHERWGQGTVQITVQPGRRNLLRIDYQRL